mmetsp:Transcript_30828/g.98288  ORF Transcript_30828/g.98288 Transcript_30828/m.98288 type:complete len:270 (-) Transcript_30828:395-1204(-)
MDREHPPDEDHLRLAVPAHVPAEGHQDLPALRARGRGLPALPQRGEGLRALGGGHLRQLRRPHRDALDLLLLPLLLLALRLQGILGHAPLGPLRVHLLQVHAPAVLQVLLLHHEPPGHLLQLPLGHPGLGHSRRVLPLGLQVRPPAGQLALWREARGALRRVLRQLGPLRRLLPAAHPALGRARRRGGQPRGADRGPEEGDRLLLVQLQPGLRAQVQVLLSGQGWEGPPRPAQGPPPRVRRGQQPGALLRDREAAPLHQARAAAPGARS